MYITTITLEQVGEASGSKCPVRVRWTFGPRIPDLVEVYEDVHSDVTPSTLLGSVHIEGRGPTEVTLPLPAGHPRLHIAVVPRLLDDDGSPLAKMPDAQGEQHAWHAFKVTGVITTTARQDPEPPPEPEPIPALADPVSFPAVVQVLPGMPLLAKLGGRIRVQWTAARDYDRYELSWTTNHPIGLGGNVAGMVVDGDGASGSFVLHDAIAGLEYAFAVRGVATGFLGLDPTRSDWSPPRRVVARAKLRGLREYAIASGLDPAAGVRRYLLADAGSVRSFMQLA
jgi:hypothetical protein